jgi:hypothetical protein
MTDAPNPSSDRREAYARVIDPTCAELRKALDDAEGEPEELRRNAEAMWSERWALALAKADQIIAMQAPAVGGEAVETAGEREERVMHQWRLGNLTPLGVANGLMKEGFTSKYATDKANYLKAALPSTAVGGGQEPVAWHVQTPTKESEFAVVYPNDGMLDELRATGWKVTPLYAHPTPVREPEGEDRERVSLGVMEKFRAVLRRRAQPTPPSPGEDQDQGSDSGSPKSRRGSHITDRSGDA